MTMHWIEELSSQVNAASRRVESGVATLMHERHRIITKLATVIDKLGQVLESREHATSTELHDAVIDAFHTGRFETLSPRQRRYAAKRFDTASPAAMQEFLAACPEHWETFAKECFRRWDELTGQPNHAGFGRVLCLAPQLDALAFMHSHVPLPELVDRHGPTKLALTLTTQHLVEARLQLEQRGWSPFWAYSAISLAMWSRLRVDKGFTFQELWHAVSQDLTTEAMLLPRLRGERRSWFSTQPRPGRVRASASAHAVFVSSLLRARQVGETGQLASFTEIVLRSELGDPRMVPLSTGWQMIRDYDTESYRRFLEALITEDLEIFFEHTMNEPRRRRYWLRFLGSVERTVCILDKATHDRLHRQFAGADKKMAGTLTRARKFTGKSAQAFCLYFSDVVVVEFSESGNAAYVYERAKFERYFERELEEGRLRNHAELKRKELQAKRILHMATDWEGQTDGLLALYRIYPDR